MDKGYFSAAGRGDTPFVVARGTDLRTFAVADGISIAPLLGERLNINVVVLEPGAVAPVHAHDEEQLGYVAAGTVEFSDGETAWLLAPGDVYHAPPGTPHGARALGERVVILDAFAPPRAEVRALLEGGTSGRPGHA